MKMVVFLVKKVLSSYVQITRNIFVFKTKDISSISHYFQTHVGVLTQIIIRYSKYLLEHKTNTGPRFSFVFICKQESEESVR